MRYKAEETIIHHVGEGGVVSIAPPRTTDRILQLTMHHHPAHEPYCSPTLAHVRTPQPHILPGLRFATAPPRLSQVRRHAASLPAAAA